MHTHTKKYIYIIIFVNFLIIIFENVRILQKNKNFFNNNKNNKIII